MKVQRAAAVAVAVAALVTIVIVIRLVGDPDDLLWSTFPPTLLIVAALAPRMVTFGVLLLAVDVNVIAASREPGERGAHIASALADIVVVAGQLAIRQRLGRQPAADTEAPSAPGPARPAPVRGPRIQSVNRFPPPTSRPPEWSRLSARQAEVLDLVLEGYTAHAISEKLAISARTVESHAATGCMKLGVANRGELIRVCRALDRR